MIGEKLRELLKEKGIKQIVFAEKVDISATRLSNYLFDRRTPDFDLLAKMAKELGVDLNYFSDLFSHKGEHSAVPLDEKML